MTTEAGTGPARPAVGTDGAPPELGRGWPIRLAPWATASGIYLAISVAFWWGAWSTHPSAATTCACGDASLYFWFLQWPVTAMAHGYGIFYSTLAFHPTGINLLNATSVLAIGIPLAPITWLFGPAASLNTASTLIPVLSALSMFWLLRRWVLWAPAAFVGGLLYGFSPFIFNGLVTGWLTTLLAVPPLIVGCLDELCMRRSRSAAVVGAALGVLVAVQFFISTEMLAVIVITAAIGLVVVGLHALAFHRDALRRKIARISLGLGVAGLVSLALLAYPLWFTFAGPAHFSGLVWPGIEPGYYGLSLRSFFHLSSTAQATAAQHRFGGYQGTALHQPEYLGFGLAAVVTAGTLLWFRDRRLWLFLTIGVASVWLCLTPFRANSFRPSALWVPWRVLGHVPVVQNILPVRFVAMVFLAGALMLGVIVDHTRRSVLRLVDRLGSGAHGRARTGHRGWSRLTAGLVAGVVASVAIVPIAAAYAGNVPLTMEPVVLPQWFRTVAPHLPAGQVVLTYPTAFGGIQSPMAWQAVVRMPFSLVGGGGPGSAPQRAGAERPGFVVLSNATVFLDQSTAYLPSSVAKVRRALQGWGTTLVVIPDQPELPAYDKGFNTAYAVALITAALGVPPRYVARAWTWSVPVHPSSALTVDPTAFRSCVGNVNFPVGDRQAVPNCMVAAGAASQAAP
jgi:hypothetical protein